MGGGRTGDAGRTPPSSGMNWCSEAMPTPFHMLVCLMRDHFNCCHFIAMEVELHSLIVFWTPGSVSRLGHGTLNTSTFRKRCPSLLLFPRPVTHIFGGKPTSRHPFTWVGGIKREGRGVQLLLMENPGSKQKMFERFQRGCMSAGRGEHGYFWQITHGPCDLICHVTYDQL